MDFGSPAGIDHKKGEFLKQDFDRCNGVCG
jgi:hypothetical protein